MNNIGFIGMGNMAQAMAKGFLHSGQVTAAQLAAYAPHQEKLRKNAADIGFTAVPTLQELAQTCDVLVMACKPHQVEQVLTEIRDLLADKVLLSVANRWTHAAYRGIENEAARPLASTRIQYIMPNTPCQIGEGVFLLEQTHSLTAAERSWVENLLSGCGTAIELPGDLIGAASAVSGCGPAFVSMMMEAMADAAVRSGVPRRQAYQLVAQMVAGTGKLMLESGAHPGEMKDAVCSPGGTTIRGVIALEHAGMRAAFMDAVEAAGD